MNSYNTSAVQKVSHLKITSKLEETLSKEKLGYNKHLKILQKLLDKESLQSKKQVQIIRGLRQDLASSKRKIIALEQLLKDNKKEHTLDQNSNAKKIKKLEVENFELKKIIKNSKARITKKDPNEATFGQTLHRVCATEPVEAIDKATSIEEAQGAKYITPEQKSSRHFRAELLSGVTEAGERLKSATDTIFSSLVTHKKTRSVYPGMDNYSRPLRRARILGNQHLPCRKIFEYQGSRNACFNRNLADQNMTFDLEQEKVADDVLSQCCCKSRSRYNKMMCSRSFTHLP